MNRHSIFPQDGREFPAQSPKQRKLELTDNALLDLETFEEQYRLEAIAQVRGLREDNIGNKRSAESAKKVRKVAILAPFVAAVGIAALPGFKDQSIENKLIDDGWVTAYGAISVAGTEGIRRGFIKKSRDNARVAQNINLKINRKNDGWILEDLGQKSDEVDLQPDLSAGE